MNPIFSASHGEVLSLLFSFHFALRNSEYEWTEMFSCYVPTETVMSSSA
jgi:hypothetical protein